MPWIAANHRTEGAVSVSAAGKDCRSTVPSNVNLRARRSSGTAKFLRSMRAETMAKGALFILGLLLLAACNDNGSSPATKPPWTVVPMNAQAWSILYSPRMPPHPTPQTGGGWYFDFSDRPQLGPLRPRRSEHSCIQFRRRQHLSNHDRNASVRLQSSTRQHLRLSGARPISVARKR